MPITGASSFASCMTTCADARLRAWLWRDTSSRSAITLCATRAAAGLIRSHHDPMVAGQGALEYVVASVDGRASCLSSLGPHVHHGQSRDARIDAWFGNPFW